MSSKNNNNLLLAILVLGGVFYFMSKENFVIGGGANTNRNTNNNNKTTPEVQQLAQSIAIGIVQVQSQLLTLLQAQLSPRADINVKNTPQSQIILIAQGLTRAQNNALKLSLSMKKTQAKTEMDALKQNIAVPGINAKELQRRLSPDSATQVQSVIDALTKLKTQADTLRT